MMVLYSVVHTQQLLVEVELVSLVFIYSQAHIETWCAPDLCLFSQREGVPVTEGTATSLVPPVRKASGPPHRTEILPCEKVLNVPI